MFRHPLIGIVLLLCTACLPRLGYSPAKNSVDAFVPRAEESNRPAQPEKEVCPEQIASSETETSRSSVAPDRAAPAEKAPEVLDETESRTAAEPLLEMRIDRTLPIVITPQVEQFIKLFQTRLRDNFSSWLARSSKYTPFIKAYLKSNDLPEDLAYLALVESGFNPYAYSRAKASGLWQFIAPTGKRYGLTANWWVDERRDPEKSTIAASRYLRNLYDLFACWYLAAAGYNAGEAKIAAAVRRYGTADFWELVKHPFLKQETKDYVPQILAATVIAKDPKQYGFDQIQYEEALCYEKVTVPEVTDLGLVARACEISFAELQDLNPELLRGHTPPNVSDYEIKIPCGKKERFLESFEALRPQAKPAFKIHVVKKGETLLRIAKAYGVKVEPILEVNHLTNKSLLSKGINLLIPVPILEAKSAAPGKNRKPANGGAKKHPEAGPAGSGSSTTANRVARNK